MKFYFVLPSSVAAWVNEQRGEKSVQSYIISVLAEKQLSQTKGNENDATTIPQTR